MKLGGSSSSPTRRAGKGASTSLASSTVPSDVREVRLESDATVDGFEDRQNDLADGAMQLRDGLGRVVARLGAVEPRRVARAPGDELPAVEQPGVRGDQFHRGPGSTP